MDDIDHPSVAKAARNGTINEDRKKVNDVVVDDPEAARIARLKSLQRYRFLSLQYLKVITVF